MSTAVVATEQEIFSVPGWNFIGGDRQIEAILRDLPPRSPLVVRNRLANVLATVAGLTDLGRLDPWEPLPLSVRVPENALVEPALPLGDVYPPELLIELLLTRLYSVPLAGPRDLVRSGSVLVATGYTEDAPGPAAALADWLLGQPDLPVVLLVPAGRALAPCLRSHAVTAWSTQHWGGLNAFSMPTVEEAVLERSPTCIYVAAADPVAMLYTAIGAADLQLRQLAVVHGARAADPREAGARVRALAFCAAAAPGGAPATLLALVKTHLEVALGVASTAADPRFRATGEAIAIDLV